MTFLQRVAERYTSPNFVAILGDMGEFKWSPSLETWDKPNLEAYKFMFTEAKDKYEDVLSESESITNKAIKLTVAVIGFMGWFAGVMSIDIKKMLPILVIVGILYFVDVFMLISLLFPKKIILRGTSPRTIYPEKDIEAELETIKGEEVEKIIYFHQLKRYQKRIDKIESLNVSRAFDYKICLIGSFALFIITIALFFFKIFN